MRVRGSGSVSEDVSVRECEGVNVREWDVREWDVRRKNNDTSLLHYVTFIPIMGSLIPRSKNWEGG